MYPPDKLWVKNSMTIVSYCGLIMLYWAWQLKTILQSWGILPPSTTSVGFLLHTSWFLFSSLLQPVQWFSWVFHSLILFLRFREQVPVCGPTFITWSPSQLHSRSKQSSGNTCNVTLSVCQSVYLSVCYIIGLKFNFLLAFHIL